MLNVFSKKLKRGDIMALNVAWSCGNPFYYGYGFDLHVIPLEDT